jgi:CelD/BcsL family acetyltransferase involved in cellulose biosynthesis
MCTGSELRGDMSEGIVVQTVTRPEEVQDEWQRLLHESRADNAFLTWPWLSTWWTCYGAGRALEIIACRDDRGRLKAAAPFYRYGIDWCGIRTGGGLGFLGTGEVCSDYLDVIAHREHEEEYTAAIFDYLAATSWDILALSDVPEDSPTLRQLELMSARHWYTETDARRICPHLRLPRDWEAYLTSLSSDFRKQVSYYRRRLNREFSVQLQRCDSKESVDAVLQDFRQLHARWWSARDLTGNIARDRMFAFHQQVAQRFYDQGWLRLYCLRLNGQAAGVLYGFAYGGRFYYYNSGFAPDFARYSPGTVLISMCIEAAIQEGLDEFDFIRGTTPYKYRWGCRDRANISVLAFNSSRGSQMQRRYRHAKRWARSVARKVRGIVLGPARTSPRSAQVGSAGNHENDDA